MRDSKSIAGRRLAIPLAAAGVAVALGAGSAGAQDEPAYAGLDKDLTGTTIKMAAIGGGGYEAMYAAIDEIFEPETGATVDIVWLGDGFETDRYLKQKPDDLEVRTDLGTMHLAAGDTKEAVRTYESVLKANPSFFQAQFNLAIAYRGAGQTEAAVAALRRALEIAPDDTAKQQVQQLLTRVEGQATAPQAAAAPLAAGAPFGSCTFISLPSPK